jgi:excinuclease UvrABC nuclease subunit
LSRDESENFFKFCLNRYVNEEKNPIEAVYMFPVEEEAAVINFTAEVDGRTIKTQVKKKEEARQEYDKAMEVRKFWFWLSFMVPKRTGLPIDSSTFYFYVFIFCPFNRDRRDV